MVIVCDRRNNSNGNNRNRNSDTNRNVNCHNYLSNRPQQRWNSTQLLALLTCKVKSFSLLSLQAFLRGRSQTAKLGPNSLLANTSCCRMRPPHNKAESMVGRRAKLPTPARVSGVPREIKHRDTFPSQNKYCYGRGWVLKPRLNDVQARVGATATRAHVESPLRTELFVDSCSVRHQGDC